MTATLKVIDAGPGVSVQDMGREGFIALGLSRGGAADRLALAEGAALLGNDPGAAAIEMAGRGGVFEASEDLTIALTGAPMQARAGDRVLDWNASHRVSAGERISIGGARGGVYGYLHLAGGIASEPLMGSRAAHLNVRIIGPLKGGDMLPLGKPAAASRREMALADDGRVGGGTVRVIPGPQTALFSEDDLARFEATRFSRDPRGNRHGVRLAYEGAPFETDGQLNLVSEVIVPGDIQMTGDGAPYILMPECQTTGGYPRIGTVHPDDLPVVAQAAPGDRLQFRFVTLEDALARRLTPEALAEALKTRIGPRIRDPRDIPDLLSYQLISGVTAGD